MKAGNTRRAFVVLGNQLFPPALLRDVLGHRVFMAEDVRLCTYVRHHKQKIVLFLAAMRSYRDELISRGFKVHYEQLESHDGRLREGTYEEKLEQFISRHKIQHLEMWEIEDKFFEDRIGAFAARLCLSLTFRPSPMFLTPRAEFARWLDSNRPHMAAFYQWQRRRMSVLLDDRGKPIGGKWSFDDQNRRSLPRSQEIPPSPRNKPNGHVREVTRLVSKHFADHPGALSEEDWWLPTTRAEALGWLRKFLTRRLELFGPYEDALSTRNPVLFHSVLSPALNLGLITPDEVLSRVLKRALADKTPINSLEGFVRQIIGWREFVRGIYQRYSTEQEERNFFGHTRRLRRCWFDGTTGLLPLDDVIRKSLRLGWAHHIERLMVAGNLLTLCEIAPLEAYRWFMEMFVDSSDWVMGPNVFGMGIFSDGGIFSTKPYICGSNYIRKMSDYPLPQEGSDSAKSTGGWCDIMDGLFWRFVDKHRDYFRRQGRMGRMVGTLNRIDSERRKRLFDAAEKFIAATTIKA